MKLKWLALPLLALTSCTIEPPLHLPGEVVMTELPEVQVDIEAVWDIDADWRSSWWYGWDDEDIRLSGAIEYPEPRDYEARLYFMGEQPGGSTQYIHSLNAIPGYFSRRMDFGYHHLLFWSNIYTPTATQCVVFDESDPERIEATTTPTRLSYALPGVMPTSRTSNVYNNPEIFYSSYEKNFFVSRNFEDYDYFDSDRGVWVKKLHSDLCPMVYIYLVQVVIYNNNGRILGATDDLAISSLADGVTLHTGTTHDRDIHVAFPVRMKSNIPARDGHPADIIGGKLTTFGLCSMPSYAKSRSGRNYNGSRADLDNSLVVNLLFSNSRDSTYSFNVTRQMQQQAHGGVITVEIDADTLSIPQRPGGHAGSGFDPTVDDYHNEFDHEFNL